MPVVSDLGLIREIKNNNNKDAEFQLFERYKPFMMKYYKNSCSRYPILETEMTFGDFCNEIYIYAFRKTLDYFNFDKIRDENWKIIQIFGWYIKSYVNNKYKKMVFPRHRSVDTICFTDLESKITMYEGIDEIDSIEESILYMDNKSSYATNIILEKVNLEKFLTLIPPKKARLLKERIKIALHGNKRMPSYEYLCKKFKISRSLFHKEILKLRLLYKKFSMGCAI